MRPRGVASRLFATVPRSGSASPRGGASGATAFGFGVLAGFALDRATTGRASRDASADAAPPPPPPSSPPAASSSPSGAAATWRGTFDPGSNPRVTRKAVEPGPSYYDSPSPAGLTLWQQTLRSRDMKRFNFPELDRNGDGFLEASDLRRAFGPDADVDALVAAADPEGLGRVSYKDWLALKAKLAEAHDRDELAGRGERASEETRGREKENAVADAERRRR